ncbi:MAG TPA: hypothetical protein VFY40_04715 [Blastocatellia bacterium]|nr:hypothetical protein [Blastocatellia bacterium]
MCRRRPGRIWTRAIVRLRIIAQRCSTTTSTEQWARAATSGIHSAQDVIKMLTVGARL